MSLLEINSKLLVDIAKTQPYPLLFATVSGAHLYGFPSPDSDYDVRGVHILPAKDVIGLYSIKDTIEISEIKSGLQIDLVTHDVKKFFTLLLKRNGYVLEQLYSPLIVKKTAEYEELKAIALNCITRNHYYHYLGFATNQWRLFNKSTEPKIKPLLYVFRVLLTGIYLMNTGIVEANLIELNKEFQLSYLDDLIAQKQANLEQALLSDNHIEFYIKEYEKLQNLLHAAYHKSYLPDEPSAKLELNDLLTNLRFKDI